MTLTFYKNDKEVISYNVNADLDRKGQQHLIDKIVEIINSDDKYKIEFYGELIVKKDFKEILVEVIKDISKNSCVSSAKFVTMFIQTVMVSSVFRHD